MALSPKLLRRFGLMFIGLALLVLVGTAGYLTAAEEVYTVYDMSGEGESEPLFVKGRFETVAETLTQAGIAVRDQDRVSPELDSEPSPRTAIVVERAHPVLVETDDEEQRHWTFQPTLGGFLQEIGTAVERTDRVFADDQLIPFAAVSSQPLPTRLFLGRYLLVTIHDGSSDIVIRTDAQTVGEALRDAGVQIFAADGVEPPQSEWLVPQTSITVRRSIPLTIHVDGRVIRTRSHHTNSLEVLADAGVGLVGEDYAEPGPNEVLESEEVIRVIRVTEDFKIEDEAIPYETVWQPTDQMDLDMTGLLQAGEAGIMRRRIRIRYENGQLVSETPDAEWVAKPPSPQINGYGTRIVLRVLDTPDGAFEYWRVVRMRVTSYTAESSGKSPGQSDYGVTASGLQLRTGIVAVDRSIVPWRSHVYVPGYGVGLAADTGGSVIGRWIDLGYSDDEFQWWAGYEDVYFLTPVPPADEINYLLPSHLP
jgi:uncharacterized protein YabE (DUF348 family)